ncbi:MAG: dCTP deaminase [Oscillospiraceae bacterium]
MILSGKEIEKQREKGNISITPFEPTLMNPNSYNLRLHNELLVYDDAILDMKLHNKATKIIIPEEGLVLDPGKLYLGRTFEHTSTQSFVPMLEGRSSVGRLGLYIHVTAGFGDVGFHGFWTLEIHCVQPIKIYPMIEICQIYYHAIQGEYEKYKSEKYQNNKEIQVSMLYKDFHKNKE